MESKKPSFRARALVAVGALSAVPFFLAACSSASPAAAKQASSAHATKYPTGPVTVIVPASAGQNADLIARQAIKDVKLGQPLSVVDRPDGAGTVGTSQIVQSAPDGSTIGLVANGYLLLQPQMKQLPYKGPSTYTPVAQLTATYDGLFVASSSKWKTLSQFLTYAKAHPGKIRLEVGPTGSIPNINALQLEKDAGVKFTLVPAVAAAGAVTDLVGGHVDAVIGAINSSKSYIKAHKIRALGVMAPDRLSAFSSVPTLKEKGYNVQLAIQNLVIAPPHTSAAVVGKLASAFHKAVKSKGFQSFAKNSGVSVAFLSGKPLHNHLESEYKALGHDAKEFYSSKGS